MAKIVGRHSDRFAGFAGATPLADPAEAAEEASRVVRDLGALVQIQSRFRVMSYSISHETSNLYTHAFEGRARTPRSRTALERYFRFTPIPNAFGEFEGRTRPEDS